MDWNMTGLHVSHHLPEFAQVHVQWIRDTWPLHGSLPCHGEGACVIQWSYEPCYAGSPKTDGSEWRVLRKCGPEEERMETTPIFLREWKAKKIWHWMTSPSKAEGVQYATGKSGGQLLTAPERMRRLGQGEMMLSHGCVWGSKWSLLL